MQQCVAAWRARGRVPGPTRSGKILDMQIVHMIEATAVDGVPVDLVVEARATKASPVKRFGVVFADDRPVDVYPIPVLWVKDGTGSLVI